MIIITNLDSFGKETDILMFGKGKLSRGTVFPQPQTNLSLTLGPETIENYVTD